MQNIYHPLPTEGELSLFDIAREKTLCAVDEEPTSEVNLFDFVSGDDGEPLNMLNPSHIIDSIQESPNGILGWYGYNHLITIPGRYMNVEYDLAEESIYTYKFLHTSDKNMSDYPRAENYWFDKRGMDESFFFGTNRDIYYLKNPDAYLTQAYIYRYYSGTNFSIRIERGVVYAPSAFMLPKVTGLTASHAYVEITKLPTTSNRSFYCGILFPDVDQNWAIDSTWNTDYYDPSSYNRYDFGINNYVREIIGSWSNLGTSNKERYLFGSTEANYLYKQIVLSNPLVFMFTHLEDDLSSIQTAGDGAWKISRTAATTYFISAIKLTMAYWFANSVVHTLDADELSYNSAMLNGEITSMDSRVDDFAYQRGFCYKLNSVSGDPTVSDTVAYVSGTTGVYEKKVYSLTAGTTYKVRAFMTTVTGTDYGSTKTFTTADPVLATVVTYDPTEIGYDYADVGGAVTDSGGRTIQYRGIAWAYSYESMWPTYDYNRVVYISGGVGEFFTRLEGLTYHYVYYRAFAVTTAGDAYGDVKSFVPTYLDGDLPTVTTANVSSIGETTATCGGNVTDQGDASVTKKGVVWCDYGLGRNPNIYLDSYTMTDDGTGLGSFVSYLTGLSPNMPYRVVAYAVNSYGVGYGEVKTFQTIGDTPSTPVVSTNTVTSITGVSATCGGVVVSGGDSFVYQKGCCWLQGSSGDPDLDDYYTDDGTYTGGFTSYLTGLSYGTAYRVRAYAINNAGIGYGVTRSFTTNAL